MERVAIFYFSRRPGPGRRLFMPHPERSGLVFVRCVEVLAWSTEEALRAARPQPDEEVMNTHYVEESK